MCYLDNDNEKHALAVFSNSPELETTLKKCISNIELNRELKKRKFVRSERRKVIHSSVFWRKLLFRDIDPSIFPSYSEMLKRLEKESENPDSLSRSYDLARGLCSEGGYKWRQVAKDILKTMKSKECPQRILIPTEYYSTIEGWANP